MRVFAAALLLLAVPGIAGAQANNPCRNASHGARIGPASGERIAIEGQVLQPDGQTPARDVIVYTYQTGADGEYDPGPQGLPELHAFLRTDADGRFRLETIRPGHYPGGGIPAHLHFQFWAEDVPAQWADEVWFASDPLVDAPAGTQGDYYKVVALDGSPPSGEIGFVLKDGRDRFPENIRHGLRACDQAH